MQCNEFSTTTTYRPVADQGTRMAIHDTTTRLITNGGARRERQIDFFGEGDQFSILSPGFIQHCAVFFPMSRLIIHDDRAY